MSKKNLVIVESPAKAKTIEKFLGEDYHVVSSYGHIRDLEEKKISIDFEHNYQPKYIIPSDKKERVDNLKKEAKAAETIWLASDEDREGEAIAWHLYEVLGLKEKDCKRIVFHEITKPAILNAIKNPRNIDINLVNAQQARRVLDRIVGFELSPILWRKIKPSLSAGRVQSVAVRLIVEREREIQQFNEESSYRITGIFKLLNGKEISAELDKRFSNKEEAEAFLEKCKNATFTVGNIEKKPSKRTPAAPFTTSTLQQEAARKLGFSVSQTMRVAQTLYEAGKITYMRTDSVNLSSLAINTAKEEIIKMAGDKYSKPRQYNTRSKGAQEAHEAIRPTYISSQQIEGTSQEQKLYTLIWKRTIASQMADAEIERTIVTINIDGIKENFIATGEVVTFDGFLKVYLESTDDENESETGENLLPQIEKNEKLSYKKIDAVERFSQHPPRYTEASLVRKLEELGIGRPSTYAPTISTIQNREYVIKDNREGSTRSFHNISLKDGVISSTTKTENFGQEKSKLFPTDIGTVVNDILIKYFPSILNYNFTADIEKEFDLVAEGKCEWEKTIDKFYKGFHPHVEDTIQNSEKKIGERELGIDPKSGKLVFVKIGRFGPIAQIGSSDDEEKPTFASLQKNQSIATITLEEALKLFELPRTLGEFEGKEMVVSTGRFGPYIRHDNKFYSLKKGDDPMAITEEYAIELINEKRKADSQKIIKTFTEEADLQILNGRFGPYISYNKSNYKIPKTAVPENLSYEDVKNIIKESSNPKTKKNTKKKN